MAIEFIEITFCNFGSILYFYAYLFLCGPVHYPFWPSLSEEILINWGDVPSITFTFLFGSASLTSLHFVLSLHIPLLIFAFALCMLLAFLATFFLLLVYVLVLWFFFFAGLFVRVCLVLQAFRTSASWNLATFAVIIIFAFFFSILLVPLLSAFAFFVSVVFNALVIIVFSFGLHILTDRATALKYPFTMLCAVSHPLLLSTWQISYF